MQTKLLITHNDLDGVACAVLARLAFKDDVDVVIVKNPQDATAHLAKIAKSGKWKEYGQILVTDVSYFPDRLIGLTKKDAILHSNIRVFDHHPTAIPVFADDAFAVIKTEFNGHKTCGAELFQNYLYHKGLIQLRPFFVETVRQYDTWEWKENGNQTAQYLSMLSFALGFTTFIRNYAERLSHADVNYFSIFSEKDRTILEYLVHKSEMEINAYLDATRIVKARGLTFGFVYVTGGDQSTLGNRMCVEKGVDVAFMYNPNNGKVSVRTTRKDLDLGALMRDFFGKEAGGHPMAAGATADDFFVSKAICDVFRPFGGCELVPQQKER